MGEKANGRLERQLRRMVALLYADTPIRRYPLFRLPVFVPINRQVRERLANGHHRDRIDVDVSRSSDHPVDRVRYVFGGQRFGAGVNGGSAVLVPFEADN